MFSTYFKDFNKYMEVDLSSKTLNSNIQKDFEAKAIRRREDDYEH